MLRETQNPAGRTLVVGVVAVATISVISSIGSLGPYGLQPRHQSRSAQTTAVRRSRDHAAETTPVPVLSPRPPQPGERAAWPRRHALQPRCKCFSTCTRGGVMDFMRVLPQNISPSSPWYAYLTAVYGEPPQLPFNMQDITFVHHNTQAWSQKHPALFWPMPPCLRRSMQGNVDKVGEAGWPDCSEDSCRAWRAGSRGRGHTFAPEAVRTHYYSLKTGETMGIGWTYVSRSYWIPPSPAGTWREVTRHAYTNEGSSGYGYWFSYATGSGMWINVGRTAVVPDKNDLAGVAAMFYPAWCRLHNRTCANYSVELFRDVLARGLKLEPPNRILPFAAYDLGYDTVQFQRGVSNMSELVATSGAAMVRPGCSVGVPRTAHNYAALMAVRCPRGRSGCGGGIEFRTGARAEHPCVCDESQPALNCNLTA